MIKTISITFLSLVLAGLITLMPTIIYAQDNQQYHIQKWKLEQDNKQFDENHYQVGGLGTVICPDIRENHGIVIITYPTGDEVYEWGCNHESLSYTGLKGYEVISMEESDITGLTTVKLAK